jgi:prevent-host-death family protein
MDSLPIISTVAQLQRNYRPLVNKLKKTNGVMVVVSNGRPDVVMVDPDTYNAKAKRLKELEEDYLLRAGEEAMAEYKAGKTITLKKGQKISDLL